MKKVISILCALAVAGGLASEASAATTWRTVATKGISGGYTITSLSRTIVKPRAMRAKTVAARAGGSAYWSVACSRGWTIKSRSGHFSIPAGTTTHAIPRLFQSVPDSCDVVLSFDNGLNGGSISLRLQKRA